MGSMLEYPVELMLVEVPVPVEPQEEDIVPALLLEVPGGPVLVVVVPVVDDPVVDDPLVDDPVVDPLVVPELVVIYYDGHLYIY